jgi:hypothetical protein
MAITITYNSNLKLLYQTFYSAKKVDLTESLAWLINDEKSMGVSEEQVNLIILLAHFYFDAIKVLRQVNTPTWEYLDWLTQEEYDTIMYKRETLEY